MNVSTHREVTIDLDGGGCSAYVVPPSVPSPAVIVIGSIFGVTEGLRKDCDELADSGFLVIAPDLFWRTDAGPLSRAPEERARAFARYEQFDVDLGVADIGATMAFAKQQPENRGGIAILGYCFGGLFAFLGATRLGADAGIAFHGTKIGDYLAEADRVNVPLSLHFGESDDSVPMSEVDAIRAALRSKPGVTIYTYPSAKHGFTQTDSPSYDATSANDAKSHAISLLATLK